MRWLEVLQNTRRRLVKRLFLLWNLWRKSLVLCGKLAICITRDWGFSEGFNDGVVDGAYGSRPAQVPLFVDPRELVNNPKDKRWREGVASQSEYFSSISKGSELMIFLNSLFGSVSLIYTVLMVYDYYSCAFCCFWLNPVFGHWTLGILKHFPQWQFLMVVFIAVYYKAKSFSKTIGITVEGAILSITTFLILYFRWYCWSSGICHRKQ